MNGFDVALLSGVRHKMQYLSERQAVLTLNIANADTPGYVPRDLAKPDFKRVLMAESRQLTMARTSPSHLGQDAGKGGIFPIIHREITDETNPNKNKVSVEEEIQNVSINQMEYQQMATLYRKTLEMFRTALGRAGA